SGSTTLEPVGANLTVANDIAIASGQTLSVDSSTNRPFFLSGVISGDGAFAAQNQATFTFSGANTYTGGTTLDNAEIFIGNDSAFGTGDITITSGSDFSATVDGINVANNIDLDNSLGLSLEGSNDFTLSGDITGTTGGVFNINTGISTLAGTNTIPGEVRVSTGTLSITGSTTADEVNSFGNGVLAGSGTIVSDVTIFGRVSPGATGRGSIGSFDITGSLDFGAGIYDMEIASTAGAGTGNDLIEVTGNIVDLNGFLFVTPLDTYTPAVGDSFTVLTSTTGIPGLFPNLINLLPAMFRAEQEVVGNSLIVNILAEDIANVVTARNLVFAAEAFDRIRDSSPTGDLATIIDQLETLNAPQLINAFEAIVPNYLVTQSQATFRGIDVQNNNINGRLNELRYGLPANFSDNLTLKTPYDWKDPIDPEQQYMIALQSQQSAEQQQEINRFSGTSSDIWGAWISGFGTFGDFNPALSQAGYEFNTGGVTLGFDYRILDTLAAGAFAGYANTGTTVNEGQGSNYANTINTGLYMTWFNEEGFYVTGLFGGGVSFYENNRRIRFGNIDRVAESSATGFYLQALATGGYEFTSGNWGFGPQIALQYANLQIGSHSESRADSLNLDVGHFQGNSFVTRVGGRLTYEYETPELLLVPELVGFWQHEYLSNFQTTNIGIPAANESFAYTGISPSRDSGLIGVNLIGISQKSPVSFSVQYNVNFIPNQFLVNNLYAGVRFTF
ncbi:MAG: autotransporter domain-containing protein, partial [Desulfobacterales bacterium]|nr:autotransporter domain-containing protein [Desulfobacterales bacterium]